MIADPNATRISAPPPKEHAASYEPPAIAWEEPFEAMAATSCAAANPFEMNCQARPLA